MARASAGEAGSNPAIRREVLSRPERTKLNPERDTVFYEQPRFVTHVDDNFLAQLTQLYRCAPATAEILCVCVCSFKGQRSGTEPFLLIHSQIH